MKVSTYVEQTFSLKNEGCQSSFDDFRRIINERGLIYFLKIFEIIIHLQLS